jgi:curved DNA-binding protein CbpA
MTREQALENLNLAPAVDRDEIEKAYQRLVRRYPPEFHPDRFRQIDESYRFLVSLSFLLEKLLSPALQEASPDPLLFSFSPSVPEHFREQALGEIRKRYLLTTLWQSAPPGDTSDTDPPF